MSKLNELIDKAIHDIKFNGCNLPESIIRLQFDNIVACAKLEESRERNNAYLESIGTAHGNGGNDRPNVIGDCITEPEQVGRWYQYIGDVDRCFNIGEWYFCPTNNPEHLFAFIDKNGQKNGFHSTNRYRFDLTNPRLNNPDLDYVNPITN